MRLPVPPPRVRPCSVITGAEVSVRQVTRTLGAPRASIVFGPPPALRVTPAGKAAGEPVRRVHAGAYAQVFLAGEDAFGRPFRILYTTAIADEPHAAARAAVAAASILRTAPRAALVPWGYTFSAGPV